jgi:Pentapeptide repeats (9 copies)
MVTQNDFIAKIKRLLVLNTVNIILIVILLFISVYFIADYLQASAENEAFKVDPIKIDSRDTLNLHQSKGLYEIYKLRAEIRQIRSDTSGGLFWLKLVALFITVGGAVGGFLLGQSKVTRQRLEAEGRKEDARLEFERRKDVDASYQAIVLELSSNEPILRASAAVKLSLILQSFPVEWNVSKERQRELIQLTKQVLAAALSIEKDAKVLKTITIALVLHRPWKNDPPKEIVEKYDIPEDKLKKYGDVQDLDLSNANAVDAYWARVNFTYSDFYSANLERVSFRDSILEAAQFRESNLTNAVLINAKCHKTNFKLADLRWADFSEAELKDVNFEGAKVFGMVVRGAKFDPVPTVQVDASELGNNTDMMKFSDWLEKTGV